MRLNTSLMKSPYKGRVRDKGPLRPKKSREQNLRKDSEAKDPGERVQKVLAQLGMGSRRQIEEWIKEGKIRLNGQTAKLGDKLRPTDRLVIGGRSIDLSKRFNIPTRVLIYYKPSGELVTRHDPEGRPVVFTQLPKLKIGRWITVGRLDINTQGCCWLPTTVNWRIVDASGPIYRARIRGASIGPDASTDSPIHRCW